MDTKKLRQKILDLAIHGKLVPQDPNDEPASVLLERIKAEKEQLIKEGKIKRQKKSTSSDTSHYGNIPDEWCEAPMSELFILNPKSKLADESLCGFIPMSLVEDGFSGRHYFETRNWGQVKKGFSQFQNGDIGIAKISPCFENLKSVIFENLPNGNGAGTTELTILRSLGVYSKFYLYLFKSGWYISEGTKYFKGVVGQQRVNKEIFTDLIVPLPPLNEQKRIVEEIDRYFALVDVLEQNEYDLKDAVQKAKSKILDLALSGRLTSDTSHYPQLPQSQVTRWDAKTIDEIFYHNTGKALNKSDSEGELYDYITTSNLYWNKFDLSSVRKMKFKSSEIEKCSVRKGDLLICEGGDVGRAAVWNYDFNIMIQNHIHRLRCRLEANPKFYYYVMMYYKSKGMISGKGIGLMGLSSKELGKLQVPYPQIEEQNDIVTYLDYTMKVFDSIAD